MKKRQTLIVLSVIAVAAVGGGAYMLGKNQNKNSGQNNQSSGTKTASEVTKESTKAAETKTTNPDSTTTQTPTSGDPVGMKPDINKTPKEVLFYRSQSRQLSANTAWEESPVAVEYRDFNLDEKNDAFVYGVIPGTMGYSFAAVWTLDDNDKPKELWYLPSDQYIAHSTWSINSINTLINNGKIDDGGTIKTKINNWHWQNSGSASGFVIEPDI